MEFLLLFLAPHGAPEPEPAGMAEMGRYAAELASRKILKRGAPLASAGACVRVRDRKVAVTDGPFAESKELVAGFWIVDVADRDAAIELARRSPHARQAAVEVHRLLGRHTFPDAEEGRPFLHAFLMEPGPRDPDGALGREMRAFGEELVRAATLLETAPLASAPPPARVEVRGGRPHVTDGPFAESKEAIAGYGLVRSADRAASIELAQRWPHARWGTVEVREILFFDRV
jgi:hypothetical protein